MGFFEWKDRYNLEIEEMDNEHKTLIQKMNMLWDENKKDNNAEKVVQMFLDFAAYTTQHFESEEKYMQSIEFPDLARHKILHTKLLEKVMDFVEISKKDGKCPDELFDFLNVWLSSHICGIDTKYAAHANSTTKAS